MKKIFICMGFLLAVFLQISSCFSSSNGIEDSSSSPIFVLSKGIDNYSPYLLDLQGRKITYRQALEITIPLVLDNLKTNTYLTRKDIENQKSILFNAIKIFGVGSAQEFYEKRQSGNENIDFSMSDYTRYKEAKNLFFKKLEVDKLPFKLSENALKLKHNSHYIKTDEINYALEQIIQTNAYKYTGGDS